METEAALEIKNLNYSYKSNWLLKNIQALKGINLEVHAGEAFGFLGPNGAGKTTTIKCILGLIRPRKGSIKIFGLDSHNPAARKYTGYLPEQPYFYDHLSVNELMQMYARLSGIESSNVKTFVKEALEKTKMLDRIKSPMRTLSKGLTQRVALAQAIVAKPKMLILDEPFSGLDPIGRMEFREIILELKALGTTILMSSHILSDVEFICNRASILVRGELKGIFDLAKLQKTSLTTYELIIDNSDGVEQQFVQMAESIHKESSLLRLVFKNSENARQALKSCLDSNIRIDSFHPYHAGLEEIFLDVVKSTANES
jgi:ABC-2 type transport system ATP-binding protein